MSWLADFRDRNAMGAVYILGTVLGAIGAVVLGGLILCGALIVRGWQP